MLILIGKYDCFDFWLVNYDDFVCGSWPQLRAVVAPEYINKNLDSSLRANKLMSVVAVYSRRW